MDIDRFERLSIYLTLFLRFEFLCLFRFLRLNGNSKPYQRKTSLLSSL